MSASVEAPVYIGIEVGPFVNRMLTIKNSTSETQREMNIVKYKIL